MTWIKLFDREVKLRPFVLSSTLRKIRGKWRDGKYTGRIVITGSVEITNGPKHAGPYRNHFVNNALQALGYILLTNYSVSTGTGSVNISPLNPKTMYLGTNTTVATFPNMQGLVAPIGTPPGTGPNNLSSSYGSITNGYQVVYTATWNAGTVSGTIGEMALYGTFTESVGNANSPNYGTWGTHTGMLSRLSVADGDFSAFTINTSYPLVITWTIQFVFA